MIMVSVNVGKDKESIIGLLLDTHLLPAQGAPNVTMGPDKKLIQTPGQQGIQGFGVVATDKGFIVGPLSNMTPIMNPDGELSEVEDGERKEELST